jgi:hypothetical protein
MRVKHLTRDYFATVHVETADRVIYTSQYRDEAGKAHTLQKWNSRQPKRFWAEWAPVSAKAATGDARSRK